MISHNPKLSAVALAVLTALSSSAFAQTAELPAVQVNASADASAEGLAPEYAGGQVATGGRVGVLGTQSNMETPFSLTSYTSKLIQDKQAASVGDVLLNDPAVRVARGFGNFQQSYIVRGLPIYSDDMSYNGLYGLLPRQYIAAELVERVEVLRGASAFLNGAAPGGTGLGGSINVVPKRAPNFDINQATVGIQDGGETYVAGDFARRFNDGSTGVRATVARRDGDTNVDGESRELTLFTVGADFHSDKLRVSADLGYQDHKQKASQPSITFAAGVPIIGAPSADRSIAQPWTYSNADDTFATVRAEYDFNKTVTGWVAGGVREGREDNDLANPIVTNAAGDTSTYRFTNVREDSVQTAEAGLRFKFNTGVVKHTVSTSVSMYDAEEKNAYAATGFYFPGAVPGFAGNIYSPTAIAPPVNTIQGGSLGNPYVIREIENSSFAIADTMSFMKDQLLVTLGARHQKIESRDFNYTDGLQNSSYSSSATTPVAGVVYKISPQLSTYANYIEGLVKGDAAPLGTANFGEMLKPYKTEQAEVGLKYDGGKIGGSFSIFQSDKPSYGTDSNTNMYTKLSEQTNQGVEITAFGKASNTVTVLGGVSFLNTDANGREATASPWVQANVGAEWAPEQLKGFAFETRALYTSSQYADIANTQEVPSWTRLDLGVRYVTSVGNDQALTLRARLDNVTDRNYWASVGGFASPANNGYLTVGNPRTLTVSASLDF